MGAFEELVAGEFFNSIITPFTTIGLSTQIIYVAIWGTMFGVLMMRSRSWSMVMLLMMATSFAIVPLIMPGAQKYMVLFIIGGFAFLLYDIFKSGR